MTQLFSDLFSNRTANWLITGVAGFIGSNLLEQLLKHDQRVVGLDNFSTGYQVNLEAVKQIVSPAQWANFTMLNGDITNLADCRRAVKSVDYILHQAALGSVPASIDDPLSTHNSNVNGFLNMLLAARDAGVKRFVYAASSASYGDDATLPKTESKLGNPLSPYAATKTINELYAHTFALNYGMEPVGLRYFNVFGPRQDPDGAYAAVIPQWFKNLVKHEPVFINGDGETTRDFCYVTDVVQANIRAALATNPNVTNQVYNVAGGASITLNQLFTTIRDQLGLANTQPTYREFRTGDVRHSLADISKAQTLLGFAPAYTLQTGLAEAASYYKSTL